MIWFKPSVLVGTRPTFVLNDRNVVFGHNDALESFPVLAEVLVP